MVKKTGTKEQILRAAATIINKTGVLALTLEAVAKEAKISKGGLLYHFPSKDALLAGMVYYLMQNFVAGMKAAVSQDTGETGKWIRAYTTLTFNQKEADIDMNTAFLAAVATNPELLKHMAKSLQEIHTQIENDNINPIMATVIRLAVDGMYFNQLYGINLKEAVREKVLAYLLALTKEDKK